MKAAAKPPLPYGDVSYAWPEEGKYPIDTPKHVRAAWVYCHKAEDKAALGSNYGKVRDRIIAAWKRLIDEDGPPAAHQAGEPRLWHGHPLRILSHEHVGGRQNGRDTIQLARLGSWDHPEFGKFSFTIPTWKKMIENFDANVRGQLLPYDVEHKPANGAAAWFTPHTMRILELPGDDYNGIEAGPALCVDVDWTPKGKKLKEDGEYKYSSLTWDPLWLNPETGEEIEHVIFGAAMTCMPFVKNMRPIQGSVFLSEFNEVQETTHMANERKLPKTGKLPNADGALPGANNQGLSDDDENNQELADKKTGKNLDDENNGDGLAEGKGNADKSDDGDGNECYEFDDDMPVEEMAEMHKKNAATLAGKLKGTRGAPAARAHLQAAHQMLQPVVDKLKSKENKMSEETTPPAAGAEKAADKPAAGAKALTEDPQVRALAEEVASMKRELAESKKEAAIARATTRKLADERRKTETRTLAAQFFPSKSGDTYQLPRSEREKVEGLLLELAEVDSERDIVTRNVMELSEDEGLPQKSASTLRQRFVDVLKAIPKTTIHRQAQTLSEADAEGGEVDDRAMVHRQAKMLSEKEGIPFHEAAERIHRQNARRRQS